MKVNVFVELETGVYKTIGLQENFYSHLILEDELVQSIDEETMSPDKILASRFIKFLGDRRLTMAKLTNLSTAEQKRLREEFIQTLER